MAEFYENMKITLYFMKLEDKYWGLFLLGLFVLFYACTADAKPSSETEQPAKSGNPGKTGRGFRRLLVFTLVTSLICICPVTAYAASKLFPVLNNYYWIWHMVPAGVVICTAMVLAADKIASGKKVILFFTAMFVVFLFAGEFAYLSADAWNDDKTFLGKEQAGVYQMLLEDMEKQEKETASLWGPYKLMADSRIYSAKFRPVYGKDIAWNAGGYSEVIQGMYQGYALVEDVNSPVSNKEEQIMAIANYLNAFPEVTCDYVIMLNPKTQGADVDPVWIFEKLGYEFIGETESYQMFRRL